MTRYYCHIFLLWLLISAACHLNAQPQAIPGPASVAGAVWPLVESRLDLPGADTARHFILRLLGDQCGKRYDCQYQTCLDLMLRLENHRFNLPAAIFLGEEMVKMARQQESKKDEADARMHLSRYFDALGIEKMAAQHLDQALELYEQAGDRQAARYVLVNRLERSLRYRDAAEVLAELDALLGEAIRSGDTSNADLLHIRMLDIKLQAGRYDAVGEHLNALDKIAATNPQQDRDWGVSIVAAMARAELAKAANKPGEAAFFFKIALGSAREQSSRWLEINILQSLAEVAWGQGQEAQATAYLDSAQMKAEQLRLHDLLTRNYALKARIAEAGGRYREALRFLEKKHYHDEQFKARRAGFDLQNYYLEKEKEQLKTEKENREQNLRRSIALLVLALSLAVVLAFAFFRLRKRKRTLIAQNALIRQQTERLENLDVARSAFFANVSHELRTPLTLLLGPLQTLAREPLPPQKQNGLLQTAVRGAKQLEQLVNELLDVQKLESGQMALAEEPTLLRDFFETQLTQFESLASYKQVDFTWKTAMDKNAAAYIDRLKCQRLLSNLLSNAFRFTPVGGKVACSLSYENGLFQMMVADTGPGIHPGDLPHLFDRFFQTNQADKQVEGGMGIGLALCQEYVRLFGGEITVESTPGAGSEFRAAFPLTPADQAQVMPAGMTGSLEDPSLAVLLPGAQALEMEPLPPASADPRPVILLVEDHVELRAYIRLLLDDTYRVETAGNGREALRFLEAAGRLPELVISDIMMPVMDGFQLLEALKNDKRFKNLPLLFLTARAGLDDRLRAFRTGIDDYVLKPFEPEELLARIGNALRNREARREWQAADAGEPSPAPAGWLDELTEAIRAQIGDPQFNIDRLAESKGIGRSTLYRRVREETGLSANQLVQELRLQQARILLESGQCTSLQALADAVGFRTPNYLSRLYRERFGKSPLDQLRNAE